MRVVIHMLIGAAQALTPSGPQPLRAGDTMTIDTGHSIGAVSELCDRWDARTEGETEIIRQIRAAIESGITVTSS